MQNCLSIKDEDNMTLSLSTINTARLGRPPAQITVGTIIRETEEDLAVMDDARQGIGRFTKRSG
jgi:hypothetical protein